MDRLAAVLALSFTAYFFYALGHYRGVNINLEEALVNVRHDAFMNGFAAGVNWENNKHSLSCNGA